MEMFNILDKLLSQFYQALMLLNWAKTPPFKRSTLQPPALKFR